MIDLSVIIPTLNAENELKKLLPKIKNSVDNLKYEIIVIDSESKDGTLEVAKLNGAKVISISKQNFNHGGTRNLAAKSASGNYLLFLTQDALLFDDKSINNLISVFQNNLVAIAYGRQIPYPETGELGSFARFHNYPNQSVIKGQQNKENFGIKTVFNSNSFSMYRKDVFDAIGGFPEDVVLGEDMFIAAKLVLENYKIAYVSNAIVYHSHDYSILQEFRRNFDIGVFHRKEKWILEAFSKPEGEGIKFVITQFKYLMKQRKSYLIPYAFFMNLSKFLGYKLGYNFNILPFFLIKKLSMYNTYWLNKEQ